MAPIFHVAELKKMVIRIPAPISKPGWDAGDELRLSFAARQSEGMNEFDTDNDFDGFIEDQDLVSEFRNTTMRVQADYQPVDSNIQHKLLIAQSKHDNENFAASLLGVSTASSKDQFQYIGSLFWGDSRSACFVADRARRGRFSAARSD